ncbi:MAG: hypothetical protein MZV70_66595 [Desulfobacterales bacterium]|nr:hypothetical protein [Desulfobacterales bacterium]
MERSWPSAPAHRRRRRRAGRRSCSQAFLGHERREAAGYLAGRRSSWSRPASSTVRSWGRGLAYFGGRLSLDALALLLTAVFVLGRGRRPPDEPRIRASCRGVDLGQLCGLRPPRRGRA